MLEGMKNQLLDHMNFSCFEKEQERAKILSKSLSIYKVNEDNRNQKKQIIFITGSIICVNYMLNSTNFIFVYIAYTALINNFKLTSEVSFSRGEKECSIYHLYCY